MPRIPSLTLAALLLSSALAIAGTRTFFSPDDDTQQVMLDFASSAQKSILIADYSFTCALLVDILVKKHAAGVNVLQRIVRLHEHPQFKKTLGHGEGELLVRVEGHEPNVGSQFMPLP